MTLSLTAVLTLVFWLTQALRFFDYVVNRGMSAVDLIELSLLILPTHLSNIAALAIFCAVMFVYLRARAEGELVSMRASGLSPWRLSWPAVLAGLVSAIALEFVSVYAAPPALTASRDRQIDLQEQHAWFAFLEAGVFTTIDANFTVYVRERTHERVLKDVFIVDSRDESHAVVYTAEDASVRQANGAPVIDMRKGLRQEFSMLSEQAVSHHGGLVHFDRYTVPIRSTVARSRTKKLLEHSVRDLMRIVRTASRTQRLRAENELYRRLCTPLFLLISALFAAATVLTRRELRTSSRLFVLRAFAGVVLMQVIPLVSEKLSLQYGGYVLPLLYGASGLLVVWSMARLVGSRTLRPTRT